MKVEIIDTGYYSQNCYVLKKDNYALVIDPGSKFEEIKAAIADDQLLAVLLTHHHFDHVGAVDELLATYIVPIIDSKSDNFQKINPFYFEIISTPGHTSDSITFYFVEEKIMFTGDFLFAGGIGRTDLPGGSMKQMQESLKKIFNYPKDTIIYPGHGGTLYIQQTIYIIIRY